MTLIAITLYFNNEKSGVEILHIHIVCQLRLNLNNMARCDPFF